MKKQYYEVCPECGAHLDPGEKCDCGESMRCSYCGKMHEIESICACEERKAAFEEDIRKAKKGFALLKEEYKLSSSEMMMAYREIYKNRDEPGRITGLYNLGFIRGMREAKKDIKKAPHQPRKDASTNAYL